MAHDVFISYAAADKPTADAVCATLEARQIRCWIAPRDVLPGEDYAEALIRAIHETGLLLLVFSSSSNQSSHVVRELERAASRGVPILPFRIEDVPLSPSMEFFISRTHWLDAMTPPLERHLEHLAETVNMLLARAGGPEQVRAPPEAAVSPASAETALGRGVAEPMPPRGALEAVKAWVSRPIVRVLLGIGAAVTVIIIVLVALLSGGGEGDQAGVISLSPTSEGGGPAPTPTPTSTATPIPTIAPTLPKTDTGSQIRLEDAPYYLDASAVLPGFQQLDPRQEQLSNADLDLGPDFSEVVVFLSEEPFQLTYMFMFVASGDIEKASAKAELRDVQALEEAFLAGFYEGAGTEEVEATVEWSDPPIGDVAKLASFTASFEGVEVQFEMLIFYQEAGEQAAEVGVFSLWRPGEPAVVDTTTIAEEISARIASR